MDNNDYKKLIIKQIDTINSNNLLKFVYELICSFKRNWDY